MEEKRTLTLIIAAGMAVVLLSSCTAATDRGRIERSRDNIPAAYDLNYPGEGRLSSPGESAALDDYLRYALMNNPGLHAALSRWQASAERVPQARLLNDPALVFEYYLNQADTRYRVGLTQMFPPIGTLNLREQRAVAEAEGAMHVFENARLLLYEQVARAFFEYRYLFHTINVTRENIALLAELEEAVNARYQTGGTPYADLVKVQVERDRLADRLASLHDQRHAQSAALAALLNLPAAEVLPWPDLSVSDPPTIDESILAAMLADGNPALKSADAGIIGARHNEALARRAGWPGFMLGVGWMVMSGMDGRGDESDIGLMAGITLPVWRGGIRAGIREADAMIRTADFERHDLYNRLRAELSAAIFKFRDADRRRELFEFTLIPRAGEMLAVARQDYAAGNTDFMMLIDAQRTLLEFRLQLERTAADREAALAAINRYTGFSAQQLEQAIYNEN